jgi:hypothetical protein
MKKRLFSAAGLDRHKFVALPQSPPIKNTGFITAHGTADILQRHLAATPKNREG